MLVYLAGAIDGSPEEDVETGADLNWRENAKNILITRRPSICTYDPSRAFYNGAGGDYDTSRAIQAINRLAIYVSDGVLVYLTRECFGTIREIEFAKLARVPVVVVCRPGELDALTRRVETADLVIFENIGDACRHLVEQMEANVQNKD